MLSSKFGMLENQKHLTLIINRTKDIKNLRTILVSKHFKKHNYDPNNHRKIILTDQLKEIAITRNETLKERLKKTMRKLLHNKT